MRCGWETPDGAYEEQFTHFLRRYLCLGARGWKSRRAGSVLGYA